MKITFGGTHISIESIWKLITVQIICAISTLLYPLVIKYIIDEAIINHNTRYRNHVVVAFIILSVAHLAFSFLRDYFSFQFIERSRIKLKAFFLQGLHRVKYETYIKTDISEHINLFDVDVANVINYNLLIITDLLSSALTFLGTFYILLSLNYKLTFICFSIYPLYFLLLLFLQKTVKSHIEVIRDNENIEKTYLLDEIKNTKLVRTNNLINERVRLFSARSEHLFSTKSHSQRFLLGVQYSMSVFNVISSLILIIVSLYFYDQRNNVTIGTISAFYSYVFMLYGPLMLFAQAILTRKQCKNSKRKLLELIQ